MPIIDLTNLSVSQFDSLNVTSNKALRAAIFPLFTNNNLDQTKDRIYIFFKKYIDEIRPKENDHVIMTEVIRYYIKSIFTPLPAQAKLQLIQGAVSEGEESSYIKMSEFINSQRENLKAYLNSTTPDLSESDQNYRLFFKLPDDKNPNNYKYYFTGKTDDLIADMDRFVRNNRINIPLNETMAPTTTRFNNNLGFTLLGKRSREKSILTSGQIEAQKLLKSPIHLTAKECTTQFKKTYFEIGRPTP